MKELDKKTKKKVYFTLILIGAELLIMGILCIINNDIQLNLTHTTCTDANGAIIGCSPNTSMLNALFVMLLVFIINIVIGIYLIIKGIKIKKSFVILVGILSFLPIPAWFLAIQQIGSTISRHVWAKPVLYLYPTQQEQVTITFKHPDNLLTTYPKYETKWQVTANPDGSLYDENGKYYYALYWDEKNTTTNDFKEGFYVTKDNAIEFLEETLSQIGLTRREQNEFIMYWLPILEENEKSIVNYTLTEQRQKENKLVITPTPDSLLRVAINIKKVDKKVKIKKQELPSFTRKGFTAIEWGGTIYKE